MINGECCGGPVFGSPPWHIFKNGVLKLRDDYQNETNDSMIMFYGGGGGLSGCAGEGGRTWGFPVYSLPYIPQFPDSEKNITIESISKDGSVSLRYNQKQISLKPQETWFLNTTRYEDHNWNSQDSSGKSIRMKCTSKLVTTDSFYNAGILDKRTIVFFKGLL